MGAFTQLQQSVLVAFEHALLLHLGHPVHVRVRGPQHVQPEPWLFRMEHKQWGSQAQGAALFSSQVGYSYKTLAYAYFYDANCGCYRVDATLSPAVYRSF